MLCICGWEDGIFLTLILITYNFNPISEVKKIKNHNVFRIESLPFAQLLLCGCILICESGTTAGSTLFDYINTGEFPESKCKMYMC